MARFWYRRSACSSISANERAWTTLRRDRVRDLAGQQLPQQLDGQVPLRHAAHLGEELVGEDRDVRLLQAGRGEDVDDLVGGDGPRDDLADGVVELVVGLRASPGARLGEHRAHGLEEADVVADRAAPRRRDGQRERLATGRSRPAAGGPCRRPVRRMCSWAAGSSETRSGGVPVVQRDQSKPWNRPRQISCFSSITATASSWSSAVSPVPPLSV